MNPLSNWTIAVAEIPAAGKLIERAADDAQRAALAKDLDILDVSALSCRLRIRQLRQGRYQVEGNIDATVEQACVVSLEPVTGTIETAVDVEFWPEGQISPPASTPEEEYLDPDAKDEAEPIIRGTIDYGRLVFELLATSLDPFPRKAGAELAYDPMPEDKASIHPFAALAKLKQQKP